MLLTILYALAPIVGFIWGWWLGGVLYAIVAMFVLTAFTSIVLIGIDSLIHYFARNAPFRLFVSKKTYIYPHTIHIVPDNNGDLIYTYQPRIENGDTTYRTIHDLAGEVIIRKMNDRDSCLMELEEIYTNPILNFIVGPKNVSYIFYINEQED